MFEESKDLKTGMTTSYEIAGKTVVLKPVTLGKMKKAMMAFQKKDADTFDMLQEHLLEILANGENEFATADWISENVTFPVANKIIEDMRVINGLGVNDFLKKGATESASETRDLIEKTPTPSV